MELHIVTLFPGMFPGPFGESILKRAQEKGLINISIHGLRQFGLGRHQVVDDYPFGGGPGMVMRPEPWFAAVEAVRQTVAQEGRDPSTLSVVLLTPQGRLLRHQVARELAAKPGLILLCGHYEGVDERVRLHLAEDEISIGDYVLTGGELPAMVLAEAVARLLPGVLGAAEGAWEDSLSSGLLEGPQYTRPREFRGWDAPEILLSGNHALVAQWRRQQALRRTRERRPDLLEGVELSRQDKKLLETNL